MGYYIAGADSHRESKACGGDFSETNLIMNAQTRMTGQRLPFHAFLQPSTGCMEAAGYSRRKMRTALGDAVQCQRKVDYGEGMNLGSFGAFAENLWSVSISNAALPCAPSAKECDIRGKAGTCVW